MSLCVRMAAGHVLTIPVQLSETVSTLKSHLRVTTRIPTTRMRLRMGAEELSNGSATLVSYGVQASTILDLEDVEAPPGTRSASSPSAATTAAATAAAPSPAPAAAPAHAAPAADDGGAASDTPTATSKASTPTKASAGAAAAASALTADSGSAGGPAGGSDDEDVSDDQLRGPTTKAAGEILEAPTAGSGGPGSLGGGEATGAADAPALPPASFASANMTLEQLHMLRDADNPATVLAAMKEYASDSVVCNVACIALSRISQQAYESKTEQVCECASVCVRVFVCVCLCA
jgi:hypothetical protein